MAHMISSHRLKTSAIQLIFLVLYFSACSRPHTITSEQYGCFRTNFATPADTNNVWCYWYWLNDDISKEGVTKDLEAMKAAGIGTAFIGNINPPEVNGRVPLFSDEWWDVMVHAVKEGKRLGINIGTFNCPGWSQSGGPWIRPEMSMRHLVSSETRVTGGGEVRVTLPKAAGIFQDVYVLAIPDRDSLYHRIDRKGDIRLSRRGKNAEIELDYPDGTLQANSLLLYPPDSPLKTDCEIQAWLDGAWKTIKKFPFDRSNNGLNVGPDPHGPVAVSLPGVVSGKFRLICLDPPGGQPPVFSRILLTDEGFLESFVEKKLGKMHPDPFPGWGAYRWTTQAKSQGPVPDIGPSEILDISSFMDKNGNLDWQAPAGKWIVMRFGMTPTGTQNSPAAPQGKGYEVDKANIDYIRYHFAQYIGEFLKRIPEADRPAFKYVIADSYEMGSQNWTDGYAARFMEKYGYDPKVYFPVLTGRIVGSADESERFLWDLRRAIADDVATQYVGGLRQISHENGLKIWLENYGHWGFPSEFLMYGGQSDLVSGEFWTEGALGNIECKAASSAAHIYGKKRTSAESFTASGNAFGRYPAQLKRRGDWSFTEGINQVVAHVYIHQPDDVRIPGINAWFGTEFNRHNTWFRQSKSWFDYERRCQEMLQQGQYAADVCYFIGEDAPKMTGIRQPELPKGYSYDYINAEVILNRLSVKDGRLTLPDGLSYSILVLPPEKTMRPEVLEKIADLVSEGAVILGPRPERSPSLQGYPGCDEQVRVLADKLWGTAESNDEPRKVGRGYVFSGPDLAGALEFCKIAPDFNPEGDYPVLWTHRTLPGMEIYFITNQGDEKIEFRPSFRVNGLQPQLWDAVTGQVRLLPESMEANGRTYVPLTLEPARSWFVVFSNQKEGITDDGYPVNFPDFKTVAGIGGPWTLDFANKEIGPAEKVTLDSLEDLATDAHDSIRYYSGTMTYTTHFQLPERPEGKVFIDLGRVSVIAGVKINGSDAGGSWIYPWRLEVSKWLKKGDNELRVEVSNLWRNRLIYDQNLPETERYTHLLVNDVRKDDQPPSSGLLGPVTLESPSRQAR